MQLFALFACATTPPTPVTAPAETTPAPGTDAGERAAVAAPAPVQNAPVGAVELQGKTGLVKVTPVYHGTVRIEAPGVLLWVDPWSKAPIDGPAADLVLITDVHFDHLDAAALEKVVGPATALVAPPAVAAEYKVRPIGHVLKNAESVVVKGVTVEAVPMYNLVRGPEAGKLFHDKGRGNGYIVTVDGLRIYLAGDTECTPEMKALTQIDLALVPMNLPYTMPPEEAAACVAAFKPKQVTPYHYAGSDLSVFSKALAQTPEIKLVERNAYPGGLPF